MLSSVGDGIQAEEIEGNSFFDSPAYQCHATQRKIPIMNILGFVLQVNAVDMADAAGRRCAVIHLYGRLADGGTFLVRDFRQRPHFYIRAADSERTRTLVGVEPLATTKQTLRAG